MLRPEDFPSVTAWAEYTPDYPALIFDEPRPVTDKIVTLENLLSNGGLDAYELSTLKDALTTKSDLPADAHHRYSILIAWTKGEDKELEAMTKSEAHPVGNNAVLYEGGSADTVVFRYTDYRNTLIHLWDQSVVGGRNSIGQKLNEPPILLFSCFNLLAWGLMRIYSSAQRKHPGIKIRVPIAEIRVKDIALRRYLRFNLDKAGLDDIAVRADAVRDPNRKEYRREPNFVLCAECWKLSDSHLRCVRCKVRLVFCYASSATTRRAC